MNKALYAAQFLFCYGSYALLHLTFSIVLLPLVAVFVHGRRRTRLISSMTRAGLAFFIKVYFPSLGGYTFREVSGLGHVRGRGPVIFVANHRGRMDGLFVLAHVGHAGVVMKSAYLKQPLFVTLARFMDFVSVDASSMSQLSETMRRGRRVLEQAKSLLVFPEGTRAPTPKLLRFRDFAFRLSMETGVPVVPVVVHTDVPVLGKRYGRPTPERRFAVTVRVLEPQTVHEGERAADFAARIHQIMNRHLVALDAGTSWEELRGKRVVKSPSMNAAA